MYSDKNLYGWLFTYNPHTSQWAAFKSEHLAEYFNDIDSKNVIRAAEQDVLQALIGRYGSIEKINESVDRYVVGLDRI